MLENELFMVIMEDMEKRGEKTGTTSIVYYEIRVRKIGVRKGYSKG